jgi:hypothetical protein
MGKGALGLGCVRSLKLRCGISKAGNRGGASQFLAGASDGPAKSENRSPKPETKPKAESRTAPPPVVRWHGTTDWDIRLSVFAASSSPFAPTA